MYNFEIKTNRQPYWGSQSGVDQEIEKFFEAFTKNEDYYTPVCELSEFEKIFTVSLDMPGIKKEDVNIELKDNQLYVSGERKKTTLTDSETVLKTEKVYGKCARVFTLPKNVKAENIEARFENGVLEIMIPKEEKTLPRKISITDWKETELKN